MSLITARVPILVFGSGFCGLVYQLSWIRLVQPLFGHSTAAVAVVLAIFMGGVGLGGLVLAGGKGSLASALRRYSALECAIAVSVALSPFSVSMLMAPDSLLSFDGFDAGARLAMRIVFLTVFIGVPAFLMGGTFPSLVRAGALDGEQTSLAKANELFLINIFGALCGIIGTTFFFLEALGTSVTLWLVSVLNLGLAGSAAVAAMSNEADSKMAVSGLDDGTERLTESAREQKRSPAASVEPAPASITPPVALPALLVVLVAAVLGFSFLLMELVWYRMLYPILGGTPYTLGLILCVVLPSLGCGRLLQASHMARRMPSTSHIPAVLCLCALLLAIPYALGDHIAVVALFLRPLADVSFWALAGGWLLVTIFVVAPVSVAVGYLFPLFVTLVALGGPQGARKAARAYVWNSLGSIAGALVGGLVLFSVATPPEVWCWNIYVLLALALLTFFPTMKIHRRKRVYAVACLLAVAPILLTLTRGPTPAWRQSLASARMGRSLLRGPNEVQNLLNNSRRGTQWSGEGSEYQSVMQSRDGYAIYKHGRPAGDIWQSHASEKMIGVLAGIVVEKPERVMLMGLGTGVLADALASIASVESIFVVEPDLQALDVARFFRPVNGDVLGNPRLRMSHETGFDALRHEKEDLDLIVTTTSDPFRGADGGTNSLEFYQEAAMSLSPRGAFFQEVPVDDVLPQALRTLAVTLRSVFPSVEIWEVGWRRTLLFVARRRVHSYDIRRIRELISVPPYRTAMHAAWGVGGVEGLFTGFVAAPEFADTLHLLELDPVETLDRPTLEFIGARNLGSGNGFSVAQLRELIRNRDEGTPRFDRGTIDWGLLAELRTVRAVEEMGVAETDPRMDAAARTRSQARAAYSRGDLDATRLYWTRQESPPGTLRDLSMMAEALAAARDNLVLSYARRLREENALEADAVLTRWFVEQQLGAKAFEHALATINGLRLRGSGHRPLIVRTLDIILTLARSDRTKARDIFQAVDEPFFMHVLNDRRLRLRVELAFFLDIAELCVDALAPFEPDVPWDQRFLAQRYTCYSVVDHDLADAARADLNRFEGRSTPSLERGLKP